MLLWFQLSQDVLLFISNIISHVTWSALWSNFTCCVELLFFDHMRRCTKIILDAFSLWFCENVDIAEENIKLLRWYIYIFFLFPKCWYWFWLMIDNVIRFIQTAQAFQLTRHLTSLSASWFVMGSLSVCLPCLPQ